MSHKFPANDAFHYNSKCKYEIKIGCHFDINNSHLVKYELNNNRKQYLEDFLNNENVYFFLSSLLLNFREDKFLMCTQE